MKRFDLELAVGIFMLAGILCLGYLSIKMGKMEVFGKEGYELKAVFSNSGGLKTGAAVVVAGVEVGRVKRVVLDDYQAVTYLDLPKDLKVQEDAIASIKTKGLIGEKYLDLTPGGSEKILEPGERIRETQPAVDIEQLISNYVFGKL